MNYVGIGKIGFNYNTTTQTGTFTIESGSTDGVVFDGDNTFSIRIQNNKGPAMPSTGGIGTTILYLVGACLVIGAGVVLVTRRRVNNAE